LRSSHRLALGIEPFGIWVVAALLATRELLQPSLTSRICVVIVEQAILYGQLNTMVEREISRTAA
jgi:hypothetical protein